MYRAASPYRAPSPYRAASPYHGQQQPLYGHGQQQQQQQQPSVYGPPVQQAGYGHGQVQPPSSPYGHPGASPYQSSMALQNLPGNETIPAPGSITYTTTTTPDGRITYHPFKAVSASYKTPNGIVSGIQWVPAEATHVFPAGAQPASEEFTQSWQRGTLSTGDPRQTKDWQKTEEKRRRREEKESAKLLREKRREEEELRYAREADHGARERRKSFNAGAPGSIGFPSSPYGQPAGYPGEGVGGGVYGATAGYAGSGPYSRERKMSTGHGLVDQFSGLDIEPGTRQRKYSQHESAAERARKLSGNFGGTGTPYQTAGSAGSGYAPATGPYGGGGTQRAYSTGGYPGGASPNIRPADLAYPSSTTPSYGYGTALEAARSRATTPIPGVHSMGGASPRVPDMQSFPGEQQQLAAPEGFSRPLSAAHTYPPFEPIKIQNMDSFLDHIPRMPAVLTPHDVYIEDWSRFVQDLSLAWAGRLPVPAMNSGHKPKRSTLSGDLIELWNSSFFLPRGVEAILYKGRERRTGNLTGTVDLPLSLYDDDDESDDSSTTDSEEDSDAGAEKYETTGPGYGLYGGRPELAEAKRRRRDAQMERRRKRKEKKIRRKAKARAKAYSLVFITVSPGGGGGMMMGGGSPMPGSMPMPSVQGMGMVGSMHGGHAGSGIGMPGGIGGIGGGY